MTSPNPLRAPRRAAISLVSQRARRSAALTSTLLACLLPACLLFGGGARAAFPDPAVGKEAMAATADPRATDAALSILKAGGNAVDAAIAAAFAISVVEPFSAGIGGGGFAVVHLEPREGRPAAMRALDFREKAPRAATRDMFLDPATGKVKPGLSVDGHLSVGVPGTVAGLHELHRAHGRLPWRRLLVPAIDLARDGFIVSPRFLLATQERQETLLRFPASRLAFFKKDERGNDVPYEPGDRLRQPDLARTLKEIAASPRSFYEGRVGRAIAEEMKRGGGLITLEDLKEYAPTWREPLCGPYRDLSLCTMPPPSSGGVHVLQMLNLLDGIDAKTLGWHHVDVLHRLIESMRIAYADRAVHLGDPAFTRVPVAELTSKAYAELRRKEIDPSRAKKSLEVKAGSSDVLARIAHELAAGKKESQDTSHLTVVDNERNAVSLTFTVNYGFGSGLVAPGTGVLLNDEMDDFSAAPGVPNAYGLVGGEANSVQPGKIPLSSMTPLIATRGGRFFMTAGSPGGSTIITTVLQTVLHVVDYGMDAQAAIAAPRVHHQWMPDVTFIEAFGLDEGTTRLLQARGHALSVREPWGNAMCIVQRPDGTLEGGADPREEGLARGR
jgi:gamma-glutamyltranspeptidase / glutathione hydrolase